MNPAHKELVGLASALACQFDLFIEHSTEACGGMLFKITVAGFGGYTVDVFFGSRDVQGADLDWAKQMLSLTARKAAQELDLALYREIRDRG